MDHILAVYIDIIMRKAVWWLYNYIYSVLFSFTPSMTIYRRKTHHSHAIILKKGRAILKHWYLNQMAAISRNLPNISPMGQGPILLVMLNIHSKYSLLCFTDAFEQYNAPCVYSSKWSMRFSITETETCDVAVFDTEPPAPGASLWLKNDILEVNWVTPIEDGT